MLLPLAEAEVRAPVWRVCSAAWPQVLGSAYSAAPWWWRVVWVRHIPVGCGDCGEHLMHRTRRYAHRPLLPPAALIQDPY